LIILRRYQTPPRFTKAILHLLLEPAVERQAIESEEPTVTDERQLDTRHLVVEGVARHAEVPRSRVDIEPARLDGRPWLRDHVTILFSDDGWYDVSWFHERNSS
jgi:hypothetical protein